MTAQIRFHLDESVDPAIANGLRRRGVNVTTTQETGLLGASDAEQISYAVIEQRIIVTHDDDFLAMTKAGVAHSGIAYCRRELRSIGQVVATLMLIRDCMTPDEMKNHIEFL